MNDYLLEIVCHPEREEEMIARLFLTRSSGSTNGQVQLYECTRLNSSDEIAMKQGNSVADHVHPGAGHQVRRGRHRHLDPGTDLHAVRESDPPVYTVPVPPVPPADVDTLTS